jgi:hypothetical protein
MNLKKIQLTNLRNEKIDIDLSKDFGNFVYQHTGDLGMLDVAKKIYDTGEVELDKEQKASIKELMKAPICPFTALIKKEILKQL